jgi:hypothetical protein
MSTFDEYVEIDESYHEPSSHGMESIIDMTWKDKQSMFVLLILYTLQGISI